MVASAVNNSEGPFWLCWAHFGPFQCGMEEHVETVANLAPFASGKNMKNTAKNFALEPLEEILLVLPILLKFQLLSA